MNATNSKVGDKSKNRNAIIALILGLFGLVTWIFPGIGILVSIIGLIFGIKGLKSLKRILAIIGITLCTIGLLASIITILISINQLMFMDGIPEPFPLQATITKEVPGTSDWKTYTNASEKFSFKYPSDFVEAKSLNQGQVNFENDQYILSASVEKEPGGFSMWIAAIKESLKNHELGVAEKHTGSYDAYLESRMSAGGTFERNVFVITKDGLIFLTLSADTTLPGNKEPEVYTNVEQLMDQILATAELDTTTANLAEENKEIKIVYTESNGSLPPPGHKEYEYTFTPFYSERVTRDYDSVLGREKLLVSQEQFDMLVATALAVTPEPYSGCPGGSLKTLSVYKGNELVLTSTKGTCAGKEITSQSFDNFISNVGKIETQWKPLTVTDIVNLISRKCRSIFERTILYRNDSL